jgi:hypothetical protein
MPFEFVLDELAGVDPWTRPMFDCRAVYVEQKMYSSCAMRRIATTACGSRQQRSTAPRSGENCRTSARSPCSASARLDGRCSPSTLRTSRRACSWPARLRAGDPRISKGAEAEEEGGGGRLASRLGRTRTPEPSCVSRRPFRARRVALQSQPVA